MTKKVTPSGFSARRVVSRCCRLLLLLLGRQTRRGQPPKMKSVPATNTPSYVTTGRTNTRRWLRQSGGEEDGHRRRDAQSGAARNVCAPIWSTLTHSSSPATLHCRQQDALSYAVIRLKSPYRGVRGRGDRG